MQVKVIALKLAKG